MRAVKQSSYAAEPFAPRARKRRDVDALLLVAESSTSQNSFGRLDLLILCAVTREMSSHQRVLLVKLLVKSFATTTRYVPHDALQILETAELPPALERIAEHIQTRTKTWAAWSDNRRTWFVVADLDAERDGGDDAAVIRILFYDEDGECVAAGSWTFDAHGKWRFDSARAVDMSTVVTADARLSS